MKIIYFGTNHFSRLILEKLVAESIHEIMAVVTQPSDEKALKKNPYNHEVELFINSLVNTDIQIIKPVKASDLEFLDKLRSMEPDLIIVASYGQILKKSLLDIPKYGCINVHPSLLPKYRGASPVQWTILNGKTNTGITFIKMTPGMDDGPILFQTDTVLEKDWTALEALDYLGKKSANDLVSLLNNCKDESDMRSLFEKSIDQNHDQATFCPLIKKEMSEVKPQEMTAQHIINMYKAFQPWPGIYLIENNKRYKISEINFETLRITPDKEVGIFAILEKKLYIKTTDGYVETNKIQPEGKNIITGEEFIRGYIK